MEYTKFCFKKFKISANSHIIPSLKRNKQHFYVIISLNKQNNSKIYKNIYHQTSYV